MAWRPTSFQRFIRGLPTSARTALVETDAGNAYLKARGGPEGPHTLAAEMVGTRLAQWMGLSTFETAIITLDDLDEIPFFDQKGELEGFAGAGTAFVSRAESGTPWRGSFDQ